MGGRSSVFSVDELRDYQDLTYFTQKEILHVYKQFRTLVWRQLRREADDDTVRETLITKETVTKLLELAVNPFCDRIVHVFSSGKDDKLSFEDFLDLMSVFSESAPKNVKVEYAFRIYDFDGDDMLSEEDIEKVVHRLTGGDTDPEQRLSQDDMAELIGYINEEADLDGDGRLSFAEFENALNKAPDFISSFIIRL